MQDHIERGNIDLSQLKFRVLDEADEMLRMGFVEDVELILGTLFGFWPNVISLLFIVYIYLGQPMFHPMSVFNSL